MITVKFFASLREELGYREISIDPDQPLTVSEIWNRITQSQPLPRHVLIAVNMEYVHQDTLVADGSEVAFFPPVSGG
jgi:molybdopterin synthase sulfur carrier subunit